MTTPFQPLPCPGGGGAGEAGADVEGTLICDVDASGNVVGTALVEAVYDPDGVRTGTRLVSVVDGTTYVPVGTVQPCPEGCCPAPVTLCDVQSDGSSVQFVRTYTGQADGGVTVADQSLDGSPYTPTGTVGSCDPYRLCTPDATQDLNGDCGPGEVADPVIIGDEGVSSDSIITDDPTADALCGGVWDRPSQPSPFEVEETFRNATFDQPGPVLQGTAPYAGLTADPAFTGSNAGDTPGQGWLQTSDITSGTNGIWQVPNPFTTSDGMTASVTFASHDGSAQGGDGMAFVFTDGSGPAQGSAIGGLGNLGLQNWENGYVAVVLDEYGQTCSCNQEPPGPNTGAAGGCGFCTNHISIQLAGAARVGASCACCTVARADVSPKTFNSTTRGAPARLIVSIIEELGQTYVSASILWPGDTDPTVYFNRVNVTACAGPSPATLRMALYGGSGGGLRSEHEFRDAVARAAGIQDWRAFPIVTDEIPECVTSVTVSACVDVTFTEDTQTVGNGDPEAFLWLVNNATGTVIDKAQISSLPSQVGNVRNICVDSVVPVADLPNLRVYVGAETRDANGAYGSTWENLEITVGGLGCPVTPVRTLAVSAPCPLPVTIVGGSSDGTPAPVTVVNAPATFEDAQICAIVGGVAQPAFRREVRAPDGSVTFSFLGTDGIPITPDSWTPGACPTGDVEWVQLCDSTTTGPDVGQATTVPFLRRLTTADGVTTAADFALDGTTPYVPVGVVYDCHFADVESHVVCDFGNLDEDGNPHSYIQEWIYNKATGAPFTLNSRNFDGTGYASLGPVGVCPGSDDEPPCGQVIGTVCESQAPNPFPRDLSVVRDCETGDVRYFVVSTGEEVINPNLVVCGQGEVREHLVILCDDNGPFVRQYLTIAGFPANTTDTDFLLDGATPYVTVGTIRDCGATAATGGDTETLLLCDATGLATTQFLRRVTYDGTGAVVATVDTDLNNAPYVVTGSVIECRDGSVVVEEMCDQTGVSTIVPFRRQRVFDGNGNEISSIDLDADGLAYTPTGIIRIGHCDPDRVEHEVLCDLPSGVPFLRTWNYVTEQALPAGFNDYELDGTTVYTVVGTAGRCTASSADRESVCWTTTAGGSTVFTGTIRHDDSLPAPGWVLFDQNTTPVLPTEPGLTFVTCDICCPQPLGEGCWDDGAGNTGRWTSFRDPDGSVAIVDQVTGDTVDPGDVVPCSSAQQSENHFLSIPPAGVFNIPTAGLLSWSVRAVTVPVSITVGADPVVPLVAGEVVTASAPDEQTLADTVTVTVGGGGLAHVLYQTQL